MYFDENASKNMNKIIYLTKIINRFMHHYTSQYISNAS